MRIVAAALSLALGLTGITWGAEGGTPKPGPIELNNQGVTLVKQGQYAQAESFFRQALEAWSRVADPATVARDRAHTLENLGSLLRDTGRYPESEQALSQALNQLEEIEGKSSLDVGEVLENMAVLYRVRGNREKAAAAALRADGILQEPERTNNRVLLGAIYNEDRHFAEAREVFEKVLPDATGVLVFVVNANLAAVSLGEGKLDEAQQFAEMALRYAASGQPVNPVGLAALYNNLGQLYRFQHHYEEAETSYRKAIDLWTQSRGATHRYVGDGLLNFAAFEHERGRDRAAEDLYRRAAVIFEHALGADSVEALVARNELGEVLRAEHRYVAAEQLSRTTLAELRHKLAEDDPRLDRAKSNLARLVSEMKRPDRAAASSLR